MDPAEMRDAVYLEHCKNVLKQAGYIVLPRSRRVILEANYIMPPEQEQARMSIERMKDMIQREQERTIARKLFDDNLVVNTIRPLEDPVTGSEQVFTTLVGIIKPKDFDEV